MKNSISTSSFLNYYLKCGWSNILQLLILSNIFCAILISLRIIWFNEWMFLFLIWNLFLAGLPLLFAFIFKYMVETSGKMYLLKFILLSLWLLFLPNAPYIITDLVHLSKHRISPIWLDGSIVFTSALTGLFMGLLSIYFVHEKISTFFNSKISWIFIALLISITSFGIYLGRVLRFNSWDIFTHPIYLFKSILHSIYSLSGISMTGVFSCMLFFIYILFYQLLNKKI